MLERLIWHIIIHLKYFTLWLAPITPLSFQNYPALTIFGNYGQLMYHGFHHGTFRPSQPRFRADMASNNPVSGAGNEEVNNKIAFSFLSTCIILHINLTSFNRNNANATLYNYRASLLMHYGIFFISVYLYKCYFNCRQDLAEILCVQQHFVFGSLLISLIETFWAQNRVLFIFTFETFVVNKERAQ